MGSIEVTERLEIAARRRLPLGDRHEQVVAEELTERPVRPPGLLEAPLGQAAGDLEAAAAELVQPRQPPPTVFLETVLDRGREVLELAL